jgi:hypothetical protein
MNEIKRILTTLHKKQMVEFMNAHPELFADLLSLSLSPSGPLAWRAAWLLWGVMKKNDKRVQPFVAEMIRILPLRKNNIQRELLKIIQGSQVPEDLQGEMFDVSMKLWRDPENQPSVRWYALKWLLTMAEKYPELMNEVAGSMDEETIDSLSKGARHSVMLMMRERGIKL